MALAFHSGFEGGNTFEWLSVTGTPSIQSIIKKTGAYAMRCNTSADTAYVSTASSVQLSFYLYIDTLPDVSILLNNLLITVAQLTLQLTTGGQIKVYDDNTLRGTSSSVLAEDTWYRISATIDTTNDKVYVWINGTIDSNLNGIAVGATCNTIGGYSGVCTAATTDIYFDDCTRGSASGSTDIGDIRTLLSLPNSAGQYSDYDTVEPALAVHYTTYDDPPGSISDADYVLQAGKTAVRDTAGLQDSATIGLVASDTIQAVRVLARMVDNTTGGITVRDNATDYDYIVSAGKTATWYSQYFATMPNGGAAWTQTRFDAFQAGGLSSGGTTDSYLYALMVMVAYTPAAPPPGPTLPPLNMGKDRAFLRGVKLARGLLLGR